MVVITGHRNFQKSGLSSCPLQPRDLRCRGRAWSMAAWALPRTRSMYFWYSSWMCFTRMLWMRSNSATCRGVQQQTLRSDKRV